MSASDMFSLEGRKALVTGSSRGIGAAVALGFARAGADVALVARSTGALERVAALIRDTGRKALAITADITDLCQIDAACEHALSELGGVDLLVNNAGGPVFHAAILDVRDEGWRRVLDLNLTSAFRFSQQIARPMLAQQGGSIINITAPANKGWPAVAAYAAAKAALTSLTQACAVEWANSGVRVNALAPGWVKTAINHGYVADGELADVTVSGVPLNRWAQPEEMVGTAVWLASDAARYVTGAVIAVDGGFGIGLPREWLQTMDRSAATR
jgi:NAD(P)-dependent dehydrogenase (short-subunit alcohol dehydrogenase family)